MTTIDYYNDHAKEYIEKTKDVDMKYAYSRFEANTFKGAKILDLGCGSCRDTLYFLEKGYEVEGVDASEEIIRLVKEKYGIDVKESLIQDINEDDMYDGIWACASLLHLSSNELKEVFPKLINALHKQGILYMSFKYGKDEYEEDGRHYTDIDIERSCELISPYKNALLLECWKSRDTLDREIQWLNLIVRRVSDENQKK